MNITDALNCKKYTLDNGLTIIVVPVHSVPKVSSQIWYGVGSKDEKSGEKGLAHLLEHMVFKGTDILSESDINLITQKLSGYANAFTSYDYTGYLFDFPKQNWETAIDIFADCMTNCTFKEDLLHAELKAVIQELKMYKDNYSSSLVEEMLSTIFTDHPYHYPIIGFKQDLWSITRENLMAFYKKHYVPNNATLVVTGDVEPEDVYEKAKKAFGHIKPHPHYVREKFHYNKDIMAKTVTMYREVQQPLVALAWIVPGMTAQQGYLHDAVAWVLGHGSGARLYKKLVDEEQIVFDVEAFVYGLFDHNVFFIEFQPKEADDIDTIIGMIYDELELIVKHGLAAKELQRVIKTTTLERLDLFESSQDLAYEVGQSYLVTGDEKAFFNYVPQDTSGLEQQVRDFIAQYLRPSVMHKGFVLPIAEEEKARWLDLQRESDLLDARVLGVRERESEIEPGVHVDEIKIKAPAPFKFPAYQSIALENGLEVLYAANNVIPKIEIVLEFPAEMYFDTPEKAGLSYFVSQMVLEGTKHYTKEQLVEELESNGISIGVDPGCITMTMLKGDLERGLSLMQEILTNATFPEDAIAKIREQLVSDIQQYWDDPSLFVSQLAREQVYHNHPYANNKYGTEQSINSITRDDLMAFYKKHYTPQQSLMAIVGDIASYDVAQLLEDTVGRWRGEMVPPLAFSAIPAVVPAQVDYAIARDQVVLCYVGLSVDRLHPDFDKLLLFDQIFSGGAAGSMSSRLFMLREQYGLFYTISGSLVANAKDQPGMVFIKTIVSLDNLEQAMMRIEDAVKNATHNITADEFESAQQALINGIIMSFEASIQTARALLFLRRYDLTPAYFENRAHEILSISVDDVKKAVASILDMNKMKTILIGRVGTHESKKK